MEIIIKNKELSEEELKRRFEILKRTGYNGKSLPEDFEADSVDLDYVEKVKRVYSNFRLQIKSEEESKHIIDRYFNTYKTDKAVYLLRLESAKAVLETRKKTGQLTRRMSTFDFDTYKEAENLIYQLFEVTLDRPTADSLKPFIEYLKTGCRPPKEVKTDDQHDNADGEACA